MAAKLGKKCQWVFNNYKHLYEVHSYVDDDLNTVEQKQLASMIRHHRNSHISKEDWVTLFHQAKVRLGSKETMTLNEDFVKFLDSKFGQSDLKKQFSIPEILDHLEGPVRKFYDNLLLQRDQEIDEFCFDFFGARQPEDTTFYVRRFLPAALLFTYDMKHPGTDAGELMKDLFSLGSGAKTMALSPEVTGLCMNCCQERVPKRTLSVMEVSGMNKIVFRAQQADKFQSDMKYESDTDDEDPAVTNEPNDPTDEDENLESLLNTHSDSNEIKLSVFEFNPFAVTLETSPDIIVNESEIVKNHICQYCQKAFSREDFIRMHIELFHDAGKKVVPRFVLDGEEHITSFTEEKSDAVSPTVKKDHNKSLTKVALKKQKQRAVKKVGQQAVQKVKLEALGKVKDQVIKRPKRHAGMKDSNQAVEKVSGASEKSDHKVVKKIRKALTYRTF